MIEAAQYLSKRPKNDKTQLQEDARILGIRLPEIKNSEEDFEVWPENWPVIEAFFSLDGCAWQYSAMGELIGLDYKAAEVIWKGLAITLDTESFRGVMIFSGTLAAELNKRNKK